MAAMRTMMEEACIKSNTLCLTFLKIPVPNKAAMMGARLNGRAFPVSVRHIDCTCPNRVTP